jgi:hypothetical protein
MTAAAIAVLGGCVLGPTALQVSRVRYNEAIQQTRTEQMLLNLVRLQYREEPLFLDVGSVATQFTFAEAAGLGADINEGPTSFNPDSLGLNVDVGVEEKPTITLTPLQGRDFVTRLLAPLQPEVIMLLSRTGWRVDRVLRLTVQGMNGLENAASASGPTPTEAPPFREFVRVTDLLRELQKQRLLEFGFESSTSDVSAPVPVEKVGLPDMADALDRGYGLRQTEDGRSVVLTESSKSLVWRIGPSVADSPEVKEIVSLLGLKPGRSSYKVNLGVVNGKPIAAAGQRNEITMMTRSLLGTLFYLSQAIDVPPEHRRKGYVTTTIDEQGSEFAWTEMVGDLLRVRSSPIKPSNAAVQVRFWGYWYYIDNADLSSKSTLALLGQLLALQAGGAETVTPVLTLPVGS